MNPVLVNAIKAVLICEIEEDENPISFLEIVLGEGKKLLLAGSIPNADTNILLVESYEFLLEVESKSRGIKVTKGFYLHAEVHYPWMKRWIRLVLPEFGFPITIKSIFIFSLFSSSIPILYIFVIHHVWLFGHKKILL